MKHSSDAVCVCVFGCRYVFMCHRRSHVTPHAGCQGGWVEMSSGTANGGSQLSSWIS